MTEIPLEPLIPKLSFIPRKEAWGQCLRSRLVELPPRDASFLRAALEREAAAPTQILARLYTRGPSPPSCVWRPR
jgi:hypothetical protein